jgi:2-methylcitrate dehydratase PrpD
LTLTTGTDKASTRALASFLASVDAGALPVEVTERAKELFLDWLGSALAGRNASPVVTLERFAEGMGPATGPSEILTSRKRTAPLFAALVNGAASHVVEQDDLHNASVLHPGTVVFPAALATAQATGASGRQFLASAVVGYEASVRVGVFLGRSHYRVFHTTGTAGTFGAAAATAYLLQLDETTMLHALGSAGTQASGLWEFLRDGADSKQLHCAKAASDGLLSAYLARDGFTGATRVLEGDQGLARGMSSDPDPRRLVDGLGERWAMLDVSLKFHASCRHTHPAADAFLQVVEEHELSADDVQEVRAYVHQAAIDVLGPVVDPISVHQAKFSMGFVLALIARCRRAGVGDFNHETLADPAIRSFIPRIEMVFDPEIDAAYPERWIGRVEVQTSDGRLLTARVDVPKGDPGNALNRNELEQKVRTLALFQDGASDEEISGLIERVWSLDNASDVGDLLPSSTTARVPLSPG